MKPNMATRAKSFVPLRLRIVATPVKINATIVLVTGVDSNPNRLAMYGPAPRATAATVTQSEIA
ncbi:hypothetical protein D3C76_1847940 [compost metagenome]